MKTHFNFIHGLTISALIILAGPFATADAQTLNTAGLPFELRRAVENFPVTLYTTGSCSPCDAGKALLNARGVPFIEKTVTTQADFDLLKARNLGDQLPVLSVGNRTVKGYEAGQWEAALDFASYPKPGNLPRGYTQPAATPLVPPSVTTPAPNPPAPAPRSTPNAPALSPGNNPAGIRF